MKTIIAFLLIATTAYAADPKFVVKKWLPPKQAQVVDDETAPVNPAIDACECGCGKEGCKCNRPATGAISYAVDCPNKAFAADGIQLDVEWDDKYLNAVLVQVEAAGDIEQRVCHAYYPPWCKSCPTYKTMLGGGDAELKIVSHATEVQGATGYPAFWNTREKKFYYPNEIESLADLKRLFGIEDKTVGAMVAGKIRLASIKPFLDFMGDSGGLETSSKDDVSMPLGPVSLVLPKDFDSTYATANGVLKLTFVKPPYFKWGRIYQKVNAITFNGSQIQFDLPRMIDPIIQVEDGAYELSATSDDIPVIDDGELPQEILPLSGSYLDAYARSPHGSAWTYSGPRTLSNITQHLAGEHGIPEADIQQYDLAGRENIHSSIHNGALVLNRSARIAVKTQTTGRRWYGCVNGVCGWHWSN